MDTLDKSHLYETDGNKGSHVVVHKEVEKKSLHDEGKVVSHVEEKPWVHGSRASHAFRDAQNAYEDAFHVADDETQNLDDA